MIPSLLRPALLSPEEETAEDIFSSSLGCIFTDDHATQHGNPGSTLTYKSSAFGDIILYLSNPTAANERDLFGHYVWNAGITLSEVLGGQWRPPGSGGKAADAFWSRDWPALVKGRKVMELGAGSGVLSIVCSLAGAQEVLCTDYPSEIILDTIRWNVARNVLSLTQEESDLLRRKPGEFIRDAGAILASTNVRIIGHKWGLFEESLLSKRGYFDIIVAADTLWLGAEHEALLSSFEYFLGSSADSEVWIIAGFHTGRAKIAGFIDFVDRQSCEVDVIYSGGLRTTFICEIDVNGTVREWIEKRDGEDITERKKWCVVIVLKRRRYEAPE